MATTSLLPSSVERPSSRRHQQSAPSRSHSTRTKDPNAYGVPPRADRPTSSRHRAVGESNNNDEAVSVAAQSSRRSSSRDRPHHSRTESSRSGHHHHRSNYSRDTMATSVANGGGPAPIVSAQESRPQGKSGKSRTTIPAPSGTFVLGKTVREPPVLMTGIHPPQNSNQASADCFFIADWSWINGQSKIGTKSRRW
jgi:hypothetical protein